MTSEQRNSQSTLVRYDAMCRAIDAAYAIDEVKDIRDKARAIEVYTRQAHNVEAERRACEIRLRAERKVGQLLREMEKAKGAREPGTERGATRSNGATASTKTLADLGISKDQSSKWQQLADVPDEQFEAALAGPNKPTTSGIVELAKPKPTTKPMDGRALWLWARLRDFERREDFQFDGNPLRLLDEDQQRLLGEMTTEMREDTLRLAPLVICWLEGLLANEEDTGEADDAGRKIHAVCRPGVRQTTH